MHARTQMCWKQQMEYDLIRTRMLYLFREFRSECFFWHIEKLTTTTKMTPNYAQTDITIVEIINVSYAQCVAEISRPTICLLKYWFEFYFNKQSQCIWIVLESIRIYPCVIWFHWKFSVQSFHNRFNYGKLTHSRHTQYRIKKKISFLLFYTSFMFLHVFTRFYTSDREKERKRGRWKKQATTT